MGTTVTVITQINRTYLVRKTKDEIIDLLLYILDTRCEADAKIEKLQATLEYKEKMQVSTEEELGDALKEIERLKSQLAYIESFVDDQHLSVDETYAQIFRFLKGGE